MKIEMSPTGTLVMMGKTMCRLWQGKTETGVVVDVLVARVASTSSDPRELQAIEDELIATRAPAIDWPQMLALHDPLADSYEDEDDGPELDDEDD
jgi:hypothetical protein